MDILDYPEALVQLHPLEGGKMEIVVKPRTPDYYVAIPRLETAYPRELIQAIFDLKRPAWGCDEISRDEDPAYVQNDLAHDVFSFISPEDLAGRRVLDFGCGCGASTSILGRVAPGCRLTGIELEEAHLDIARRRVAYHGLGNVTLQVSPSPESLPEGIGTFDHIIFSAVFEHLMPAERKALFPLVWSHLEPGGILFLGQTPHRWFPIEGHTTGLPLINYLPRGLARRAALRFSSRVPADASWQDMLRQGIRGGTPGEILAILAATGQPAESLPPCRHGIVDHLDLWYRSASCRHSGAGLRRRRRLLGLVRALTGATVVPNITLALRKVSPGEGAHS